jgi:5-formyltetrahydrofolate cyclo-ligase
LLVAVVHRKVGEGERKKAAIIGRFVIVAAPTDLPPPPVDAAPGCVNIPRMSTPPLESGVASGAALREAKRELRDRVLQVRDGLSGGDRSQASTAIATAIAVRVDFRAAATVLLSLSFRSEWDTRPLVAAALAAGKAVAAPRVHAASRMLEPCLVTDPDLDLAPGFGGISEPLPHCAPVALAAIDWVLVPGVAFDASGFRIGYGGGYYDRLLPLLRPEARRVSGAFELQLVDRVPAATYDVRVDAIVTERRTLQPRPRR